MKTPQQCLDRLNTALDLVRGTRGDGDITIDIGELLEDAQLFIEDAIADIKKSMVD